MNNEILVVFQCKKWFILPIYIWNICIVFVIYGFFYSGQYIILPDSTNARPLFGKIVKLLIDDNNQAHLLYQKTNNAYCAVSDLYMIKEYRQYAITPIMQLADYHTIEVVK